MEKNGNLARKTRNFVFFGPEIARKTGIFGQKNQKN